MKKFPLQGMDRGLAVQRGEVIGKKGQRDGAAGENFCKTAGGG